MIDLSISQKSVSGLFCDLKTKKFVIPAYQRPYSWDVEKCETLWDDIVEFSAERSADDEPYFLGTIVTNLSENGDKEVVDGQQRITSLLLLLRSFYTKLEMMSSDDEVEELKRQIGPVIWSDINDLTRSVNDFTKLHIFSEVATEESNDIFHSILETGMFDEAQKMKSHYTENYAFFQTKCNVFAQENPLKWKQLCISILNYCVLLPIECPKQDTALRIFSTLNDRGMPLEDSDIFKARIYRNYGTSDQRDLFVEKWQDFSAICEKADMKTDDIFRIYMHILRARNNDTKSEIALRKFYTDKTQTALQDEDIMSTLISLADFWMYINCGERSDDIKFEITLDSKKWLNCLSYYPNDYWRYPVSVYYFVNKNSDTFAEDLEKFLRRTLASMLVKFIATPTVNSVKPEVYKLYSAVYSGDSHNFEISLDEIRGQLYSSSKITKSLLCLHAYLNPNQRNLLPETFEIEHILPKKWQNTNYNGWSKEDADKHLEWYGNKVAFEKKLNIQAGNGYFGQKKLRYADSKIEDVHDLLIHQSNDWTKGDIETRENQFVERIMDFLREELL
ncbi:MAG: DUF262 domain-containing HNH endonuclease family protein [Synergistaceae bacterium]|jgi:uncharacterized protein with ParB-like and HNH nuclease domain|nr:DUF262 domain-containing HNH endonuclease family protein [Synergistaceae bacterium]